MGRSRWRRGAVAAIKVAVYVLLRSAARAFKDSHGMSVLSSLEIASSYFNIRLVWVPGHSGIAGNYKPDKLASTGPMDTHTLNRRWSAISE